MSRWSTVRKQARSSETAKPRAAARSSTTARQPVSRKVMPVSTERYRATDISGDYATMARAFGGYGER